MWDDGNFGISWRMSGLVKRKDYCQFLLSRHINYTLTYFADHTTRFSHDAPTRYLRRDRITSKQIWQQAKRDLSKNGFIVFDDSVLDKNHSRHIELVYKQYMLKSSQQDLKWNCFGSSPQMETRNGLWPTTNLQWKRRLHKRCVAFGGKWSSFIER